MIYHGQDIYARHVIVTTSLFARMRGLLGRKSLGPDTAMVIDPCSSIHTLGMRFAIDVLFLDSKTESPPSLAMLSPGASGFRAAGTFGASLNPKLGV